MPALYLKFGKNKEGNRSKQFEKKKNPVTRVFGFSDSVLSYLLFKAKRFGSFMQYN